MINKEKEMPYIAPEHRKEVFTCIHCNANTQQNWNGNIITKGSHKSICPGGVNSEASIYISTCHICQGYILWLNKNIIYPLASNIPLPNEDMPNEIKNLYLEARAVFPVSKKACAALLRLSLQKLCKELGGLGKNINADIAKLVKEGLNPSVKVALDIIRITGNEAVHPGKLNLEENENQVSCLFELLNFIVDEKYTREKKINEMLLKMPKKALEAIEKRDEK